jgi:hypothetical protein
VVVSPGAKLIVGVLVSPGMFISRYGVREAGASVFEQRLQGLQISGRAVQGAMVDDSVSRRSRSAISPSCSAGSRVIAPTARIAARAD